MPVEYLLKITLKKAEIMVNPYKNAVNILNIAVRLADAQEGIAEC